MSFLSISPCCVSIPGELPGSPRGVMQPAEGARTIPRYVVQPQQAVKDDKAAMVLFYDAMGFKTTNPRIIADQYAAKLGIPVYIPDYIPDAPEPVWFETTFASYPDQFAQKSWYATIRDYLYTLSKIFWKIPGLMDGRIQPLVTKAVEELRAEGFEKIGAIGYCRGGSMVIHLLSGGEHSLLDCGIICHPAPDKAAYPKIIKPSQWHLADHDFVFKDQAIADVRQAMEGRDVVFESTVYKDTSHGFAARPNLEHEPSKKAFEEANAAAVKFLQTHMKLPVA